MIKLKDYTAKLTTAQYKKHLKHASKFCRCRIQAEDITQETFERMWKTSSTTEAPVSYVGAGIMNETRRQFDKNKLFRLSVPIDEKIFQAVELQTSSDEYLITEAINTLPIKQKKVLTMFLDDVKMKDIGVELNMPYDTVKANYRHAMLKVKEYLMQNNYEVQSGN